jgi:trehalose 6-phosphate phosphatase
MKLRPSIFHADAEPPVLSGAEALFLDFDGTLAAIADAPHLVAVEPTIPPLLDALARRHDGAVAILTGRPLAQVDALLGRALPGAGQHGAELRLRAGARPLREAGGVPAALRRTLRRWARQDPRLLLEDKRAALALHYRAASERGDELGARLAPLVARRPELTLLHGRCVWEIKPAGIDKGRALERLMAQPGWRGRVPVAVGDDTTDEDAFRAAQAMDGHGVRIGTGATAARFRLAGPGEAWRWLAAGGAA